MLSPVRISNRSMFIGGQTCQMGSGLAMMAAATALVPFISQIAASPLSFRKTAVVQTKPNGFF
jgi:hypothetical protein